MNLQWSWGKKKRDNLSASFLLIKLVKDKNFIFSCHTTKHNLS